MQVELSVETRVKFVDSGRKSLLLVRVGGVYEYHAYHFGRIEACKHANIYASQRMPDEHIGFGDRGLMQKGMQLLCKNFARAGLEARITPP
jgi:hypothetical protein